MLTPDTLTERKWGAYPEIRKAFEKIRVDWWEGGNSNSYSYIEHLSDHHEISRAILDNPTLTASLDPAALNRDLRNLREALAYHAQKLSTAAEDLRALQARR